MLLDLCLAFWMSASPFEFRALEVALEAICSFLDARTTELETAAYPALDELTKKVYLFDKQSPKMFCGDVHATLTRTFGVKTLIENEGFIGELLTIHWNTSRVSL